VENAAHKIGMLVAFSILGGKKDWGTAQKG